MREFLKAHRLRVATKFGEHWDFDKWQSYVDHSSEALKRSLDRSLDLLGSIEIVQLHKKTPAVLKSDDLRRAWEYARSLGIVKLVPSVSDLESAAATIADPQYWCIQLPLNQVNRKFENAVAAAS